MNVRNHCAVIRHEKNRLKRHNKLVLMTSQCLWRCHSEATICRDVIILSTGIFSCVLRWSQGKLAHKQRWVTVSCLTIGGAISKVQVRAFGHICWKFVSDVCLFNKLIGQSVEWEGPCRFNLIWLAKMSMTDRMCNFILSQVYNVTKKVETIHILTKNNGPDINNVCT